MVAHEGEELVVPVGGSEFGGSELVVLVGEEGGSVLVDVVLLVVDVVLWH